MKVELVRDDLNQAMKDYLKESSKDFEAQRIERLKAAEQAQYAVADELWFMCERIPSGVRATCISGLPEKVETLIADGMDAEEALFNARWLFVGKLKFAKLCATQEEARARASRATLRLAVGA